jgi:hypothetical protein
MVGAGVRASVAIWSSCVLELFIVADGAAGPKCLVGGTTQQIRIADLIGPMLRADRSVSRE